MLAGPHLFVALFASPLQQLSLVPKLQTCADGSASGMIMMSSNVYAVLTNDMHACSRALLFHNSGTVHKPLPQTLSTAFNP